MTRPKHGQLILNVATVLTTACAVLVTVLRIFDASRESVADERVEPRTTLIANWREFIDGGTRIGPKDAPVTVVEFLDFQCSFCRLAARDLQELRRSYRNDVAVVYRHLPIHKFARSAAIAAECAGRVGKFDLYHNLLFAQGDSIGTKAWSRFALEAGIRDTARFARCMSERSVAAVISRDSAAAVALGVNATPTFLINNLMVTGNPGAERLKQYVSAALKQARP